MTRRFLPAWWLVWSACAGGSDAPLGDTGSLTDPVTPIDTGTPHPPVVTVEMPARIGTPVASGIVLSDARGQSVVRHSLGPGEILELVDIPLGGSVTGFVEHEGIQLFTRLDLRDGDRVVFPFHAPLVEAVGEQQLEIAELPEVRWLDVFLGCGAGRGVLLPVPQPVTMSNHAVRASCATDDGLFDVFVAAQRHDGSSAVAWAADTDVVAAYPEPVVTVVDNWTTDHGVVTLRVDADDGVEVSGELAAYRRGAATSRAVGFERAEDGRESSLVVADAFHEAVQARVSVGDRHGYLVERSLPGTGEILDLSVETRSLPHLLEHATRKGHTIELTPTGETCGGRDFDTLIVSQAVSGAVSDRWTVVGPRTDHLVLPDLPEDLWDYGPQDGRTEAAALSAPTPWADMSLLPGVDGMAADRVGHGPTLGDGLTCEHAVLVTPTP